MLVVSAIGLIPGQTATTFGTVLLVLGVPVAALAAGLLGHLVVGVRNA